MKTSFYSTICTIFVTTISVFPTLPTHFPLGEALVADARQGRLSRELWGTVAASPHPGAGQAKVDSWGLVVPSAHLSVSPRGFSGAGILHGKHAGFGVKLIQIWILALSLPSKLYLWVSIFSHLKNGDITELMGWLSNYTLTHTHTHTPVHKFSVSINPCADLRLLVFTAYILGGRAAAFPFLAELGLPDTLQCMSVPGEPSCDEPGPCDP